MRNYKLSAFIGIIAIFVGASAMYMVMYFFPLETGNNNVLKGEKEVTIIDNGISEAVAKLYDAVVVVESYSELKLIASGSGFVYKIADNSAYILTNNHVIEDADQIKVTFTDGNKVEVEIVGSELYSDIAVLKVDKKFVTQIAEIGSSEDSKLGDTVFTVGAPLNNEYSGTVTRGIISGKNRMVEVTLGGANGDYIMKVIQTDAAINSGNSGGPIADSNGEVIGITNMKLVSSGVEGIGFAIPIEDALIYADKIEKGEEIVRPYMGVTMIDLNDLYNLYANKVMPNSTITNGVVIAEVLDNSPAFKAGILKGDVIYELGGNNVSSIAELRYYLYKHEVDEEITIKYYRGETSNTTKLTLEKGK